MSGTLRSKHRVVGGELSMWHALIRGRCGYEIKAIGGAHKKEMQKWNAVGPGVSKAG
mgnify:FL=1